MSDWNTGPLHWNLVWRAADNLMH